jgi:hypothetical protein
MGDLEVVHDNAKEMAALVHVDEQRSWGPAMVGPNAGELLAAWVAAMPFDPTILDERVAVQLFKDWLRDMAGQSTEAAATPTVGPLEPIRGSEVGAERLADRTAAESAADPPAGQPADTDLEADAGTPATVIVCPLCAGTKFVTVDEGEPAQPCGMCQGVGMVTLAATP